MKFYSLITLSTMLLFGSCRLPDEVGIGANGNQYDYLGASEQWPLTNDQGQGFGVSVWGSWSLTPKKFVMITPEREYNPFDKPTVVERRDTKPAKESLGDQVKDISSITKDMSSSELTFWVTVLLILALTAILVVPRVLTARKNRS
jgi:hypothetical protein